MNIVLDGQIFSMPYISFIAGLFFCLLGRKLLGLILILFGIITGYTWGASLLADVLGTTTAAAPWIPWAAGITGAILGLIAWKLSMFLVGTVIGLFIARGLLPYVSGIVHTGIALSCGILVHFYREPVIALLTAISGAYIAAGSAIILMDAVGFLRAVGISSISSGNATLLVLILTGIFALTGYKFQMRNVNS
ncbi:MAG: hypothetical protein ABFR50_00270 [Candidatus Fermentibacteria bacterium]